MILYVLFSSQVYSNHLHVPMLCRSFEGSGLDEECRNERQCTKEDETVWIEAWVSIGRNEMIDLSFALKSIGVGRLRLKNPVTLRLVD